MTHEGYILDIKVSANSKTEKVFIGKSGEFRVRVMAVPENGKANRAVIAILAKFFKIHQRDIIIICGETSSSKRILLPLECKGVVDNMAL